MGRWSIHSAPVVAVQHDGPPCDDGPGRVWTKSRPREGGSVRRAGVQLQARLLHARVLPARVLPARAQP
jgi:hypothetical protein